MRGVFLMLGFALSLMLHGGAFSQSPDANLDTNASTQLEARAQALGRELRCVVCQNQSIEASDAVLAQDMRRLVRARLKAGDSDSQVLDFMQQRYGDFVLLKPPVQNNTLILWFGPFAAVLMGVLWFVLRRRGGVEAAQPLSEDERAQLAKILRGNGS